MQSREITVQTVLSTCKAFPGDEVSACSNLKYGKGQKAEVLDIDQYLLS